ncbi:MAG: MarR family transcriptional regulator [Nitriliruptor sp.]|nr:MAG: MarR family transcriptional regulator [Nitriliruptor sp.]
MDSDHVDRIVEQWAEQRPELDTSGLRVAARAIRLQRYLDQAVSDAVRPFGLQVGELNVLATLRRSGPPFQLTPTQLYRGLLLSSGAMTNRLDRLEANHLITRTVDPDDRRRVQVALTVRGREIIDQAMDAHVSRLDEVLAGIDDPQRTALEDLLRTLLIRLEQEHDLT